ncbi:hypothetical protein AGMMS49992_15930 [Clostridia bacterium]|nr:hypothetical protein AGMMS49992_15930 [Clostridia bacterium]
MADDAEQAIIIDPFQDENGTDIQRVAAQSIIYEYIDNGDYGNASLFASIYQMVSGKNTMVGAIAQIVELIRKHDISSARIRVKQMDTLPDADADITILVSAAVDIANCDHSSAIQKIRSCVKYIDDPNVAILLARAHQQSGETGRAVEFLVGLPNSSSPTLIIIAAKLLLYLNAAEQALKLLSYITDTDNPRTVLNKRFLTAQCYESMNNIDTAISMYRTLKNECAKTQRTIGVALPELAILRAQCAMKLNEYDEARLILDFLIDALPDLPELYMLRSIVKINANDADENYKDDADRAIQLYSALGGISA